jgi:hypothetical protein
MASACQISARRSSTGSGDRSISHKRNHACGKPPITSSLCLPGRNHRGARRIENPGRRKKSHVPTSKSMRAGPRRGMVAGLPPRNMRRDERRSRPAWAMSRKTGVYYCD